MLIVTMPKLLSIRFHFLKAPVILKIDSGVFLWGIQWEMELQNKPEQKQKNYRIQVQEEEIKSLEKSPGLP